jgi:pyridoxal biosynthesis lyase PdxS
MSGEKMSNESYIALQQKLMFIAGALAVADLDKFLERIDRCETVAPITDPTLYREGMEKLALIKRVAKALNGAKKECAEVFEELAKLEGRVVS